MRNLQIMNNFMILAISMTNAEHQVNRATFRRTPHSTHVQRIIPFKFRTKISNPVILITPARLIQISPTIPVIPATLIQISPTIRAIPATLKQVTTTPAMLTQVNPTIAIIPELLRLHNPTIIITPAPLTHDQRIAPNDRHIEIQFPTILPLFRNQQIQNND